jgi:hypothetical protein
MTPMLQALMRDAMLPAAQRRITYTGDCREPFPRLSSFHAFDVSAVKDLAERSSTRLCELGMAAKAVSFLPHKWTWMEAPDLPSANGQIIHRIAIALVECDDNPLLANMTVFGINTQTMALNTAFCGADLPLLHHPDLGRPVLHPPSDDFVEDVGAVQRLASYAYALLAMINSPRALARREHAPHKGLERDLRRTGQPGLRPWTEILLELPGGRRIERDPGAAPGAGPSSAKAEHWVRMHPRFKRGRLEWVTAHTRGDSALGTVQATYRVRPAPTDLPSDET